MDFQSVEEVDELVETLEESVEVFGLDVGLLNPGLLHEQLDLSIGHFNIFEIFSLGHVVKHLREVEELDAFLEVQIDGTLVGPGDGFGEKVGEIVVDREVDLVAQQVLEVQLDIIQDLNYYVCVQIAVVQVYLFESVHHRRLHFCVRKIVQAFRVLF